MLVKYLHKSGAWADQPGACRCIAEITSVLWTFKGSMPFHLRIEPSSACALGGSAMKGIIGTSGVEKLDKSPQALSPEDCSIARATSGMGRCIAQCRAELLERLPATLICNVGITSSTNCLVVTPANCSFGCFGGLTCPSKASR